MSECVVRMEVPENCYECDIYMSLFVSDCPIYQKDGGQGQKHKYTRSRHPDCPILAVLPEKHGDLIDRDETFRAAKPKECSDEHWAETTLGRVVLEAKTIVPATEGGKE